MSKSVLLDMFVDVHILWGTLWMLKIRYIYPFIASVQRIRKNHTSIFFFFLNRRNMETHCYHLNRRVVFPLV